VVGRSLISRSLATEVKDEEGDELKGLNVKKGGRIGENEI
jgi:hypothetical protein